MAVSHTGPTGYLTYTGQYALTRAYATLRSIPVPAGLEEEAYNTLLNGSLEDVAGPRYNVNYTLSVSYHNRALHVNLTASIAGADYADIRIIGETLRTAYVDTVESDTVAIDRVFTLTSNDTRRQPLRYGFALVLLEFNLSNTTSRYIIGFTYPLGDNNTIIECNGTIQTPSEEDNTTAQPGRATTNTPTNTSTGQQAETGGEGGETRAAGIIRKVAIGAVIILTLIILIIKLKR